MGLVAAGDAFDAESQEIRNLVGGVDSGDAVEYGQMVTFVGSAAGVPAAVTGTDDGKFLCPTATVLAWGDLSEFIMDWDDGGATVGPMLSLQRTNAAGAAADNDIIGAISFKGEDDAGTPAEVEYARIQTKLIDVSAADEEAELSIQVMVAGTLTEVAKATLTGMDVDALSIGGVAQVANAAFLAADNAWTGSQRSTFVELTDAATVAVDFATEQNMWVTITASRTIGQPSNQVQGQCGFIVVEQDVTGGWTPSWHADWDWGTAGAPTVDTTAGKKAVVAYMVDWDTTVVAKFIGDF
jgi:hypothetical protein